MKEAVLRLFGKTGRRALFRLAVKKQNANSRDEGVMFYACGAWI